MLSTPSDLNEAEKFKVLAIGDIIGRPGRQVLAQLLPKAVQHFKPDLIIANGENAAGGFGLTLKVYHELKELGIDVITMGNHWADKKEIHNFIHNAPELIPAFDERVRKYGRVGNGVVRVWVKARPRSNGQHLSGFWVHYDSSREPRRIRLHHVLQGGFKLALYIGFNSSYDASFV